MKKYIILVLVLVVALASCTNDEIPVKQAVNFKINPATVIAPFTYEVNTGELEGIPSAYRLRVRLLIYNTDGLLVEENTQLFTSYATTVGVSEFLLRGKYIAVAISDIITTDNSATFWDLNNYESLATASLVSSEYIGDYGRKILGVQKTAFTVDASNESDIKMDIQPAGSLFMVSYWGTQNSSYAECESFELTVSKNIVDCKFDQQGNFTPTWENCDFKRRICTHEQEGNAGNRYYHYAYVLPTNNLKMRFEAYTNDNKYIVLTDEMLVSPKAGEEYQVIIDMDAKEYTAPTLKNGTGTKALSTNRTSEDGVLRLIDIQ